MFAASYPIAPFSRFPTLIFLALLLLPCVSFADIAIAVRDDGSKTSLSVSGSINTQSMSLLATQPLVGASFGIGYGINPQTSRQVAGFYSSEKNVIANIYAGLLSSDVSKVTAAQNVIQANSVSRASGVNRNFGFDNQYIYLDSNYVSGSPVGYTMDFLGSSAANLGFSHVSKNWSVAGNAISLVVSFIPGIKSLIPASGSPAGGYTVTLSGFHFTGATGVTIGGLPCANVVVTGDTTITCTAPSGSNGPASVVVMTGEGANGPNTLFTYGNGLNLRSFSLSPSATSIPLGRTVTLSATGGGGNGLVGYNLISGPCTIDGSIVTATGTGSCVVDAFKLSDGIYDTLHSSKLELPVTMLTAPSNVQAIAGPGLISVSFLPSAGGSGAVTYLANCTSSDGGSPRTATGSSSPLVVSGVTAAKSYTCTVTATDSIQQSSEASIPTPAVTPTIPPTPAPIPALSKWAEVLLMALLSIFAVFSSRIRVFPG